MKIGNTIKTFMKKKRYFPLVVRYFGWKWVLFRIRFTLEQITGKAEKKLPDATFSKKEFQRSLTNASLADPDTFLSYRKNLSVRFFDIGKKAGTHKWFNKWDRYGTTPVEEADNMLSGRFACFGKSFHFPSKIPHWHENPFTGDSIPAQAHFSKVSTKGTVDIRALWELNRFGFTYSLVRAYQRTGDDKYAACFFSIFRNWREQNPPFRGPNWKCGQETAVRVFAWISGLYGFIDSPEATPERVQNLVHMIALSGKRIDSHIDYALSQKNNHGISEAAGLWTIGLLFPEFSKSKKWMEKGKQILEKLARELIYDDGAFVQHSANYHRVMLHDFIWVMRLGEINGHTFSRELTSRVGKAALFLYQIQDHVSGRVPNYGQNDGALVFPLANCKFMDFRPVVQTAHYLAFRKRCFTEGPWDEELCWFFGREALKSDIRKPEVSDFSAPSGGCHTLRLKDGFAFVRCGSFRHRPSQADMLHVDLWWKGQNIAVDPGTFSYNSAPPWNNPFADAEYHNTVTVNGKDQMDRLGTFLRIPWIAGKKRCYSKSKEPPLVYWEGSHDAWEREPEQVSYRRGILGMESFTWIVIDEMDSPYPHMYRLHWLFHDFPFTHDPEKGKIELETGGGKVYIQTISFPGTGETRIIRGNSASPSGWLSERYFTKKKAISAALFETGKAIRFVTIISDRKIRGRVNRECLIIQHEETEREITWNPSRDWNEPIIDCIRNRRSGKKEWEKTTCISS